MTGYTCLAMSVASMGLVMYVNGDPDASRPLSAGFVGFAVVLAILTWRLYRPLFVAPVDEGGETSAAPGRNEVDPARARIGGEQDPTVPGVSPGRPTRDTLTSSTPARSRIYRLSEPSTMGVDASG